MLTIRSRELFGVILAPSACSLPGFLVRKFFSLLGAVLTGIRVWTINILTLLILIYVVSSVVFLMRQMPDSVDPSGKILILNPEGVVQD